jgi:hypothetical protein
MLRISGGMDGRAMIDRESVVRVRSIARIGEEKKGEDGMEERGNVASLSTRLVEAFQDLFLALCATIVASSANGAIKRAHRSGSIQCKAFLIP